MGAKRSVPESDWSKWYLLKDGGRLKIKRYCRRAGKTTWERYPAKKYANLAQEDLQALLRRINATHESARKEADERYNFDHTYVNQMSIQKFHNHLKKNITESMQIGTILQMLNDHVFEFFIIKRKIADPSRWYLAEDEWRTFLQEKNLSSATLKKIVATANRFSTFLHNRVYLEMQTPKKLEPFGRQLLDEIEDDRRKTKKVKTRYIKADVYEKILEHAEKKHATIIPNIKLCMTFGLRISETLGLTKDKFLKDSLFVDEQGSHMDNGDVVRKKVKTFERRVPYWNMTAKDAWAIVQQVKPMHPSTLKALVNECLAPFGHTSHDFRRTFITNSFRKAPHWKDVMKAAGHADVRTTLSYDQDDRDLSEEKAELD